MFCVVGIRPLIGCEKVPSSVSLGAIQLLWQLHSRLEVLFKDSLEPLADADAPLLWESCWTPLLAALADGVNDPRKEVMSQSFNTLLDCLNDQHIHVAPAIIVSSVICDSFLPCFSKLRATLQVQSIKAIGSRSVIENDGIEKLLITGLHCLSKLVSDNFGRISQHLEKFLLALLNFSQNMFIIDTAVEGNPSIQLVENVAFDCLTVIMVQCRQSKVADYKEELARVIDEISNTIASIKERSAHL